MLLVKPPNDFKSGENATEFLIDISNCTSTGRNFGIDLSDVIFMDSETIRLVFSYLQRIKVLIPPKDKHVHQVYNDWIDSKKGFNL